MDNSFELGGKKFKLLRVNAFKQFHIVRRIGPILSELLPALQGLKEDRSASESEKLDQLAKIATPIMVGLSKLSDADSDKVLYGLLSCVEMQQSAGNWARIANDNLLLVELDLPELLQLAGRAFMYNLSGFFQGLHQVS